MKKKGRLREREGEEEDDKGDEPSLVVLAGFATGQLGERAALRSISEAGHLVMLERPRAFNRCLREFLLQQQHPRTTTMATGDPRVARPRGVANG